MNVKMWNNNNNKNLTGMECKKLITNAPLSPKQYVLLSMVFGIDIKTPLLYRFHYFRPSEKH